MNYDLDVLLMDWCCPEDRICARIVRGRDGAEFLQLRVDLGLLQMLPDGRPDGARYRDCSSALEFVGRALRSARTLDRGAWQELGRELQQLTYRRLALSALCDEALEREDLEAAHAHLHRTLRDLDASRTILTTLADEERPAADHSGQLAGLIFTRARLVARTRALEGRVNDALEELERGLEELRELLLGAGIEADALAEDQGVQLLEALRRQLGDREPAGSSLHAELDDALAREDYKAAARLRDEMQRRRPAPRQPAPRKRQDDNLG